MGNYIILQEKYPLMLSLKVSEYMKKGWKPIGGVAYKGDEEYIQAMVKRIENDRK